MTPPKVTIVLPVYNAAATIDATIRSVLDQSMTQFELFAIDDGSSDDSLHRLLDHATHDERIRVVARDNHGVSASRNLGAAMGSAPLVAFLDADDLWAPDKLERHVAAHETDPALAASYARIAFIAQQADGLHGARTLSSLSQGPLRLMDVLGENPVCTASNMVVRRDWLDRTGGFDEQLSFAEDQDLVARIVHDGGRVDGIDAVLTGYRFSPCGLSMDLERMYAGWRTVAARYLGSGELAPLEALYCRYLSRRVLRGGGRPQLARHYALTGLRRDAASFLTQWRRGASTLIAAFASPVIPAPLRLRLFA